MCDVSMCVCLCSYLWRLCAHVSVRLCRFPVVTWRHPVTRAVLLRSSGFHSKGVIGVIKGHYPAPPASQSRLYNCLYNCIVIVELQPECLRRLVCLYSQSCMCNNRSVTKRSLIGRQHTSQLTLHRHGHQVACRVWGLPAAAASRSVWASLVLCNLTPDWRSMMQANHACMYCPTCMHISRAGSCLYACI